MHPPMFRKINQSFDVRGKPVIFCWGDTIYNPTGMKIAPQLRVHEAVHSTQQGNDPETWWNHYIADPAFRLEQEIPAHRAEYRCVLGSGLNDGPVLEMLDRIAERLSSPLYGSLIDYEEARRLIAA